MSFLQWVLCAGLVLQFATATASADNDPKILRVYGPGGPYHVMQKCAEIFRQRSGVEVAIIRALPYDLARKIAEDGDIYYGGAEYMLEEFDRENPGVLNVSTTDKLHARRIGIIVRKGNPLGINNIEALSRKEVDLLDVKLERMRHFYNTTSDELGNVGRLEYTGRQGLSAWESDPNLDAWVTYKSWHSLIAEDADFVEIPGGQALRHTPVALTHRTTYPQEAAAFIDFLKSDEARLVFTEHGWE